MATTTSTPTSPGDNPLTGEVSNSKVSAVFASEGAARAAAQRLKAEVGLTDAQVQVVTPHDHDPGRKMQPESHGIFRTILIAHARLGLAGAALGAIAWFVLRAMGAAMIVHTGLLTLVVLVIGGAMLGLMLGGLVALRPDQDAYLVSVREALREGRCAVVVHAFDGDQKTRADAVLAQLSPETITTL